MKSFQRAADQQRKDRAKILAEHAQQHSQRLEGEVNKRIKTEIVRVRKLLRQGIGLNDITTFLDKKKYFRLNPGDASPRSQRPQSDPLEAIIHTHTKPHYRQSGAMARAEALRERQGRGPVPKLPNPPKETRPPFALASPIMGTIIGAKPSFISGVANPMVNVTYGQKPIKTPQTGVKFIKGEVFDK